MASLLLGFPNSLPTDPSDVKGKKKKVPKVAVYVAGAAFAITTGLTLLVIPYVRQAAKLSNTTQFLSHQSLASLDKRTRIPRVVVPATSSSSSSNHVPIPRFPSQITQDTATSIPSGSSTTITSPSSEASSSRTIFHEQPIEETVDPILLAARQFNAREEKELFGASLINPEGEAGSHEHVSGFLGFQALGIATALVFGSAGLGAFIVAKLLGVKDMNEFSTKMRESLNLSMPTLVESVNQPGRSIDGFDGEAIDQWVATLEKEDEEEEKRLNPT